MKRLLIAAAFLSSLLFLYQEACPRKLSLKLKTEKKEKSNKREAGTLSYPAAPDSITSVYADSIKFSGFDKAANSSKESFFISNASEMIVTGLTIRLEYTDNSGKMLHSRVEMPEVNIPPGETRKVDIKSFDSQGSFFYHKSNPPRASHSRKYATPFRVRIILLDVMLEPSHQAE